MIRLGICNELFEDWEFGQVCRTVKGLGYEGLEIAPFTLAPRITDLTADRRRELRAMVEDAGLAYVWGGRDLRAVAPRSDSANFPGFFSILCSVFRDSVVTIFRVIS